MSGFGSTKELVTTFSYVSSCAGMALALAGLILLVKKQTFRRYKSLAGLLVLPLLSGAVLFVVKAKMVGASDRHLLYETYFYCYWSFATAETILMFVFCFEVLTQLFSSLPRVKIFSIRIFWGFVFLSSISCGLVLFRPHLYGWRVWTSAVITLRQSEAVSSLCVALAVFLCMRLFGLQTRKQLLGLSLGLLFYAVSVVGIPLLFQLHSGGNQWSGTFVGLAVCAQFLCWAVALSLSDTVRGVGDFQDESLLFRWERRLNAAGTRVEISR
jgi:hypothetical protein